MSALYREFILNGPSVWAAIGALVRDNAKALIENGTPLRVIVTTSERKRNTEQNAYYWSVVLKSISEQVWVAGRKYGSDVWHEHYARQFGVCEDVTLPNGDVIIRRKSTSDMRVKEFSEYTTQVEADAATEYGVRFPASRGLEQ